MPYIATFLGVHPVRVEKWEDNYIAVVMNTKLCHHEICIGVHNTNIQFPNRFAKEEEDVLNAFRIVEAKRDKKTRGALTQQSQSTIYGVISKRTMLYLLHKRLQMTQLPQRNPHDQKLRKRATLLVGRMKVQEQRNMMEGTSLLLPSCRQTTSC